jgi:signal transduction histidine kinase
MKPSFLICLVFLFLYGIAGAQERTDRFFHIGESPANGWVLDSGWIFKAGDDPAMASPGYSDGNGWIPVNAADELHHMPEVKNAEIGWFRLTMKVDSSNFNKTFAFIITGLGASEIYMNGNLIYRFGAVSRNFKEETTRFYANRLLSLTFNGQARQVLSIRYSFHKKNLYLKFTYKRPVARIVLKRIDQAFADHIKDDNFDATLRSIQVSFYLPLGFLLLFLFWSFRLQKEYLYSGIFCFCMFAAILMHIFSLSEPTTVSRSNYLLFITQVLYIAGAVSLINGSYIIFNRKRSWFFYFIVFYGFSSLVLYFISYDYSGIYNTFFFPIINFEFLRISWLALRRKRKGAGIFFLTGLMLNLSLLFLIWFTLNDQPQASAFLQSICFIIPGIGLSLFFAGEFARNAADLQQRALEIERLSTEMIAKEREKQQMLGEQNETLERQVAERTAELSKSLKDLKEAEEQLIQREKMASLGELTAGIAHEIQNPLNFVNNFSDVNTELIDELETEMEEGNLEAAKSIARDIKENEQKINHHGKRADSIVKGMLQHSRNSTGLKELTDINVLADECMRLSYHGMRAKDKSFNAKTVTDFDTSMPKINIVSQDIGRVILNLFTNAFYSVMKKKNELGETYSPMISVTTSKEGNLVKIVVRDNGYGIPQKVIDKIFQPFFTTKPTGEGTGLGLSMSYDIITKGHGGELKVNSIEGEFAEFIILLPV